MNLETKFFNLTIALTIAFSCFIIFVLAFPFMAFASDDPLSYSQAIEMIIQMLQTAKSSGIELTKGLGLAYVIVEGIMILLRSPLEKFVGRFKLIVVALLSLASVSLVTLLSGASFSSLITDSATLAAFSVFIHQIYKQFFVKKD